MRDIKDRFSELCIDKSLTFTSRATSPFSRGGKGDGAMQGKGVGDFRGMVRFCEGWVWNERLLTEVSEKRKGYGKCDNPSGSRPNFFGRQHLTFDKGGEDVGVRRRMVQM